MRSVLGILAVVLASMTAIMISSVEAKTVIQVAPTSGPAGSTLQVEGFGFASGEVRIGLAPAGTAGSGFMDELPTDRLVTLADVPVVEGAVEHAVVLPGASDLAWGKQIDILAIQEDPPTSNLKYFVTSASFEVTGASDLPKAGVGPTGEAPHGRFRPIAALVLGGALLASAGLRLRVASG